MAMAILSAKWKKTTLELKYAFFIFMRQWNKGIWIFPRADGQMALVFCFICFILSRAFSHFCLKAEPASVSSRTLKWTATTCSLSPTFKGKMGHNCYPSLICKLVLVTSLNAVTKHQQEATLREYVFTLVYSLRGHCPSWQGRRVVRS